LTTCYVIKLNASFNGEQLECYKLHCGTAQQQRKINLLNTGWLGHR